jgi:hypothetical protein
VRCDMTRAACQCQAIAVVSVAQGPRPLPRSSFRRTRVSAGFVRCLHELFVQRGMDACFTPENAAQ